MKPVALVVICGFLLSGCGPAEKSRGGMTLKSPAFKYGEKIPPKYTCSGEDISPELTWSGAPIAAQSLAMVCEDLAGRGRAIHWVIYNIPPTAGKLPENVPEGAQLPDGSQQAYNMHSQLGYLGPCPGNETHHYVFRLYALNSRIEDEPPLNPGKVFLFIDGHTLAKAELVGDYR